MPVISTNTYAPGGMGPPQRLETQLDDLVAKANARARELVIRTIQKINLQVRENTPVLTGNLRASWYDSINTMATHTGGSVVADVVTNLKMGDIYYMINGANYAGYVEYGTRHMAPRAFTRLAVARAREFAEQAAAEMGLK